MILTYLIEKQKKMYLLDHVSSTLTINYYIALSIKYLKMINNLYKFVLYKQ